MFSPPRVRQAASAAALLFMLAAFVAGSTTQRASAANGFITSVTTPATVAVGTSASITASVTSTTSRNVLIDVEVYGSTGAQVHTQWFDNQALAANQAHQVTTSWTVPANQPPGTYTVKIGVFSPGWGTLLDWNDRAGMFSIPTGTTTATCSAATLSANPATSPSVGGTVSLSATATGCAIPEYRFWVLYPTTAPAPYVAGWNVMRDYAPTASYSWTSTSVAGSYTLAVTVRRAGSSAEREADAFLSYTVTAGGNTACTGATLTASPTGSQAVAGAVVLTSGVSNAAACTPMYRFWVFYPSGPSAGWQLLRDYTTSNSFSWQGSSALGTTPAGNYTLAVTVRRAGSSAEREADAYLAYTLTAPQLPTIQKFVTLPPGAALPSSQECATRVRRSSWEPRPQNAGANATRPTSEQVSALVPWTRNSGGVDDRADLLRRRIDGAFTGTTDEIIQWGACKWGLDEDIVRAVAVAESWWIQSSAGDYNAATGENESYGLLQVRKTAHLGTFPASRDSTAFNVDYTLAQRRSCYEGYVLWLNDVQPGAGYAAGDEWGCVGLWFSGRWRDSGALSYISTVQDHLARRTWAQPNF